MAFATTLSRDEVHRSLKAQIKRPKKCIPPPKYLCTPSSLQIQQKVSTVNESHNVCDQLAKLIAIHGYIPELDKLSVASMKDIYHGQRDGKPISEIKKLPLIRRFVVRYLKDKFLEDSTHRQFWTFVHIGVNSVLRRLERLAGVTHHVSEENDRSICCVLLDVGWLNSQLGHHIVRLCTILDVRLIVLRPMETLAKLVSTTLYPLKKSIAFGVSLSSTAPLELRAWIEGVRATVPALTLPLVRSTLSVLPSQPLKRGTPESIPPSLTTKQFSVQPWSDYSAIGVKLYLPTETSIVSSRVVTVPDLWRRLRPSSASINRPQTELEFPENLFCMDAHRILSYDPTLLLTVPAQTTEHRQKRMNKKRRPEQSDSSKKAKRKKDKCVQNKT